MRNRFNGQLRELNDEMILMGSMIEKAIRDAIAAFFGQDAEQAVKIMKADEQIDREQKKIENICFQLLLQQQPVAGDLRAVTATMKMVTDMERIGDHAADISELTVMMAGSPCPVRAEHIKRMASEAVLMLMRAVEAYVERDMEKARAVIAYDDVVDELFLQVKADVIGAIRADAGEAEQAADLLMVSKYLERIGDHATNIAEWVIFSCGGEA